MFECVLRTVVLMLCAGVASHAPCQPVQPLMSLAQKEKPALIETLKELCAIESGSSDREGLDRIATVIGSRLTALGVCAADSRATS